ncbi:MAG: hypothetical protein K0M67_00565 [Thiobacillus sp.]|nr:hypothetical protein [Thiobacillus sp.]
MKISTNIIGLALGAALGQGTYFLASAFLVSRNELDVQAQLAILLSFTTLALWATDLSTSTILARQITLTPGATRAMLRSAYSIRALAVLVVCPALTLILHFYFDTFSIIFAALLAIQCIAWCFNLNGLFDAKKRNGISGPISSLNWLFGSISILLTKNPGESLDLIFIAFSTGTILTVVTQHLIYFFGKCDSEGKPQESRISIGEAIQLSIGSITAQTYPRLVLLILFNFVSPSTAGLFSFVKSAINGVGMGVSIIRRHDIIQLIAVSSENGMTRCTNVLERQKYSLALGALGYAITLPLTLVIGEQGIQFDHLFALSLFAAAVFWLLASALLQELLARGEYRSYSKTIFGSVLINLAASFALLPALGKYSIPAGEFAMCAYQVILFNLLVKRRCGN